MTEHERELMDALMDFWECPCTEHQHEVSRLVVVDAPLVEEAE